MIRYKGFTLVELMIVVAIIGILAAVGYPSYIEHVRETRRSLAQADLMELASFMERYYTENSRYRTAAGAKPTLPFGESPQEGGTKYYDLAVAAPTDSTYTLTATAKSGQEVDRCGTMTLNQAGVRTAIKSGVNVADCW